MEDKMRKCTRCKEQKNEETGFYFSKGKRRSECKVCTIKKNVRYQKRTKAWMNRFVDEEGKRSYMVDYYAKNKEKFSEYRRKFKEKYPDYHKEYARKRKNERL